MLCDLYGIRMIWNSIGFWIFWESSWFYPVRFWKWFWELIWEDSRPIHFWWSFFCLLVIVKSSMTKKIQIGIKIFKAAEVVGGAFVPPNRPPSSGVSLRQLERRCRGLERFSVASRTSHQHWLNGAWRGGGRQKRRDSSNPDFAYFRSKSDQESRLKVDMFKALLKQNRWVVVVKT